MDRVYLESVRQEIEKWESRGPGLLARIGGSVLLPAEAAAKALVPRRVQQAVGRKVHRVLAGLNSVTSLIGNEEAIRERVRAEREKRGDDLRAADAAALHFQRRSVAYAVGEGGATGALGLVGLPADIPALLLLSLRSIHQVGLCYGYDVRTQMEQEYVLHVLRVGSSVGVKAKMELLVGLRNFERVLLRVTGQKLSEALARRELSRLSLLVAMRDFAQKIGVQITRRKALQLVPVAGAAIGASFNGLFVRDVGRAAYMAYRRRWITELEGTSPQGGPES